MKYKNIIKEIDNLNAIDFTFDSLETIGILANTINNMYGTSLLNKEKDAKVNFDVVRGHLEETVFDILKKKLDFDDEVINKIIPFIDFFEYVVDIYIIDGAVIVKMKNPFTKIEENLCFSPKDSFIDITSREFVDGIDLDVYRDYFVKAYNEASEKDLLTSSDKKINYNEANSRVYVNKPLKKLMQINTDVTGEIAKVITDNNGELDYYDMKMHYGSFELLHNNCQINKLSELLSKKVKTKKLK